MIVKKIFYSIDEVIDQLNEWENVGWSLEDNLIKILHINDKFIIIYKNCLDEDICLPY